MGWTGVSSVRPGLLLWIFLPVCATAGRSHALSLYYNFSITCQARPGQPWCEIQGQVNGNEFLYYACGSKRVTPVGPWGMKLKETAFWDTQMGPMKDLGEELRKKLLDINAEFVTKSGAESLTLQGSLMCERGADGHTRGSWQFAFNGQLSHHLDPEKRKWTVVSPGGQQFIDTLDNDKELTKLLVGTANGDCKSWLQQVCEHWNETQVTTVPPATRQGTAPSKATAIGPCTWIFPLLLSCVVIMGILVGNH